MSDDPLVVLADDEAPIRHAVSSVLAKAGLRVLQACDGEQAAQLTAIHQPSLVVLDWQMPRVSGIECLRRIRQFPLSRQTPVIMISGSATRQAVLAAARAGANGFFLKSQLGQGLFLSKLKELVPAAGRSGGAANLPASPDILPRACQLSDMADIAELARHVPQSSGAELADYVDRIMTIKVLPFVLPQVIALTSSQHSTADQLVAVVEQDVGLAAKVLAVANSCAFRRGRAPVTNLAGAIRNIGFASVRQAAVGVGMVDLFSSEPEKQVINRLLFWEHSFATANIASALARNAGLDESAAFSAGLLHGFGWLLLEETFPEDLAGLAGHYSSSRILPADFERRWMGLDHARFGAAVLRKWKIPEEICGPIEHQDLPWQALLNKPESLRRWVGLVQLSDQLANCFGFGDSRFLYLRHVDPDLVTHLGITHDILTGLEQMLPDQVQDMKMVMLAYSPSLKGITNHPPPRGDGPLLYLSVRGTPLDILSLYLSRRFPDFHSFATVDAFIAAAERQSDGLAVINFLASPRLERGFEQLDAWVSSRMPDKLPRGLIVARRDQAEQLRGPLGRSFAGIAAPAPLRQLEAALNLPAQPAAKSAR